jgi:transcriptional regulator with XRE-family HTH domain
MKGNELRSTLGKNLKLYRRHRKFSQADLAQGANISLTFLSDIERRNKWPYPDTLANLTGALGVSVSTLFWLETDISEDPMTDMRQFSRDGHKCVDDALEAIFKEYQLGYRASVYTFSLVFHKKYGLDIIHSFLDIAQSSHIN